MRVLSRDHFGGNPCPGLRSCGVLSRRLQTEPTTRAPATPSCFPALPPGTLVRPPADDAQSPGNWRWSRRLAVRSRGGRRLWTPLAGCLAFSSSPGTRPLLESSAAALGPLCSRRCLEPSTQSCLAPPAAGSC